MGGRAVSRGHALQNQHGAFPGGVLALCVVEAGPDRVERSSRQRAFFSHFPRAGLHHDFCGGFLRATPRRPDRAGAAGRFFLPAGPGGTLPLLFSGEVPLARGAPADLPAVTGWSPPVSAIPALADIGRGDLLVLEKPSKLGAARPVGARIFSEQPGAVFGFPRDFLHGVYLGDGSLSLSSADRVDRARRG